MTAPLREVLVKAPGPAFGRAFDDPAAGFLRPGRPRAARREHAGLVELLERLGVTVHELGAETDDPDLVYVFDPLLIADGGAIPLRPGKPNRAGEPGGPRGVDRRPAASRRSGRIEAPGTIEGGDTFWLRPDLLVHRAVAADQRRRGAPARERSGRRRRADRRRPVLEAGRPSSSTCCR